LVVAVGSADVDIHPVHRVAPLINSNYICPAVYPEQVID